MAVKDWWNALTSEWGWGDDDTAYEDESSFDEDIWKPPTGTVNPWEVEEDPYGIGAGYGDAFDWGDDTPTVDFEDPSFDYSSFDVDAYLDSLLDPDYGGGTEGDPSDWFMNTGDPYNIGETYTKGSDEWDQIMAELSDYDPNIVGGSSGYTGGGAGSPYGEFDSLATELGYDPSTGSVEDWLQSFLPTTEVDQWEDLRDEFGNIDPSLFTGPRSRGPLGGGIGPWLRDLFLGKGGLGGKKEGEGIGGILGLLGGLFGKANTAVGTIGGGIGSLLNSPLAQLALLNYMRKKKESDIHVPIGYGDGGGGGGGDGSPIDYRVFNIQPALMPGVAYANVGKPEGMRGGGLGDVTLAKLEPGEFVVTKKAVDNIGAQNLYKMMKQWEGRG